MTAVGFLLAGSHDFLPYQNFLYSGWPTDPDLPAAYATPSSAEGGRGEPTAVL
jgi:hypothetical protein